MNSIAMCRLLLVVFLSNFAAQSLAQFERTRVNITCPCEFVSDDGITGKVSFGLVNYTDESFDELYATIGISGERASESAAERNYSAYLDTIKLTEFPLPNSSLSSRVYEIQLGAIPEGSYYFELLLHKNEAVHRHEILDSAWFKGEHQAPVSNLALTDANYLVDSDLDGVDDLNEEIEGTDPDDPLSLPSTPTIDVLILYEENPFERYQMEAESYVEHVLSVTNSIFESSDSPVHLRPVGLLDANSVPEIKDGNSLQRTRVLELIEEYGADVILTYRSRGSVLCGFAATIGGWGDKGFLHPHERLPYAEVFLEPTVCDTMVTAHELGHLMGLGHSFEQFSTGAYAWSRGHAVHGEFGTIMSYTWVFFATQFNLFSNPRLDCLGKPCGVAHTEPNASGSADSALTINILKYQFARTSSPDPDFDFDGDGVGAVSDAFPIDQTEWMDTDGDRFGDNRDEFPNDPIEWADADGDGIGNNSDPDIDNDGIPNLTDPDPFDAASTEVRLLSLASSEEGDFFGHAATRVSDVNQDGFRDLAVSAPSAQNSDKERVGKLYLLSLGDLVAPISDSAHPGVKSVADVANEPDSWIVQGHIPDDGFGWHSLYLDHDGAVEELLIFSDTALYFLTLDATSLVALDVADGTEDGYLSTEHCGPVDGCGYVLLAEKQVVTDAAVSGDSDGDGLADVALMTYSTDRLNQLKMYYITRAGLSIDPASGHTLSIQSAFDADEHSFILTTSGIRGQGDVETLGRTRRRVINDLVLGVVSVDSSGRVYILNGEQFRSIGRYDEDGDRQIEIDSLVTEKPDDSSDEFGRPAIRLIRRHAYRCRRR